MIKIALSIASGHNFNKLNFLSKQLQLPIVELTTKQYPYLLVLTDEGLKLRSTQKKFKDIFVNFSDQKNYLRCSQLHFKKELIAKAIGVRANYKPKVLDATAGFGKDGFILACFGCEVVMLERSPIVAALLQDGLDRAKKDARFFELPIRLLQAEAKNFMQYEERSFDVVYIDPMFPARTKSALVKKEMQVLQDIVGSDEEVSLLLQTALAFAKKRVIIKRPLQTSFIDGIRPDVIFKGKAHRFDVYMVGGTNAHHPRS